MDAIAGPTSKRYYVASTGTDTADGSASAPLHTSTKAIQLLAPGDTMYIFSNPTMYTSTGHPWMCFNNSNWTNMDTRTSDYFYIMGEGTSTIINNCNIFVTLDAMNPAWIWFGSMTFLNGTGSHAIYVTDTSTSAFEDIYIKNGVAFNAQYGNVVEFSSLDGTTGSNDNVFRRGCIVGNHRYMYMVGGTAGFSRRNLLDDTFFRGDGSSSPEPIAGISFYGATTGIDGADDNMTRGAKLIDFNDSSYYTGPELFYGRINHPHSATDSEHFDFIVLDCDACGSNDGGVYMGEDSAARTRIENGVIWNVKKEALASWNTSSSQTVRNVTIYDPAYATPYYQETGPASITNSIWYRTNTINGPSTDNFNNYFPSTSNPTGSTNEILSNPFSAGNVWITSPTNSANIGTGVGGKDIGANLVYQRGSRGDTYSSPGVRTMSTNVAWPIENDWAIKSIVCSSDTGPTAASNSTNVEWRGLCSSTHSISWYIWNQLGGGCPTGFCPETQQAAAGGGSPDPVSPGTFQRGQFYLNGNFRWRSQ